MAQRLQPVKTEDLIFSGEIGDDRTNTYLTLDDYDWMHYKLKTRFKTQAMSILNVEFEYVGAKNSYMHVSRDKNRCITYQFDSNIFGRYICQFLTKHMFQWYDQNYVFNGEDIVVAFYNEVLEKGEIYTNAK